MLSADNRGKPPPELEMAWLCGDGFLPDGGGINEQDYGLFVRMRYLHNVFRTVQHMRGLTGERINTGLSTAERLLLGELAEMGIPLGGL